MLKTSIATGLLVTFITFAEFSSAAMLGAPKGNVHFGRPLDINIPIRLDEQTEDMSNCFSVDVTQGESKVDAGRIRLDVTPASNKQNANLRVRSANSITEPWAKLILRSNCGATVTRQYDFLTDFVSDLPMALPQADSSGKNEIPAKSSAALTAASPATTISSSSSASSTSPNITSSTLASPNEAQAKSNKTSKISKTIKTAKKQTVQKEVIASSEPEPMVTPRLKMETFELTNESSVMLKLSSALIERTGMRTPEEIQALAQATAVWRAINGMPALPSPTSTTETAATPKPSAPITAATPKNGGFFDFISLNAGKQALSNPLVLSLLAVLGLVLACALWLWYRLKQATQIGYDWLNERGDKQTNSENMDPEFLPTAFHKTGYETTDSKTSNHIKFEQYQPDQDDPSETKPQEITSSEPYEVVSKNASMAPEVVSSEDTAIKTKFDFDPNVISEKTPQDFDDSRFNESKLDAHKPKQNLAHERPFESAQELIDMVISKDVPLKRALPNVTPKLESLEINLDEIDTLNKLVEGEFSASMTSKSEKDLKPKTQISVNKSTSGNKNTNSIDFDSFAEIVEKPKPSK